MKYRTARLAYLGIGLVATGALLVAADSADAGKKKGRIAKVFDAQTPLGLQGARGAGDAVVIPFQLLDARRKPTDVEVQFGYDIDGLGQIDLDTEFFPATEDRNDDRNTRKNGKPRKFTTAANIGAQHAFVWDSRRDIENLRLVTLQLAHDAEGRPVPDPDTPGAFLFENEDAQSTGVIVRVRAVKGKGKRRKVGDWVYSERFSLNNNSTPFMTIEGVQTNTTSSPPAADEIVRIAYTAFDPDSEDLDGDGVVNFGGGEDLDGDGEADLAAVKIHFDYHRVAAGVDPATLSQEELEALFWQPATNAELDPSDGSAIERATSPVGRSYEFLWDTVTDVGTADANYIVRSRTYDVTGKELGDWVYLTQPFRVENHRVFASLGPNSGLATGRSGHTVTNLTVNLPSSDPLFPGQSFLVVGGETGAGVTSAVDVMLVNALSAETSRADRFTNQSFQLATPRAWHSAVMLDDGRVLIAGGADATGRPLTSTEIYDPSQRATTPGPELRVARSHHAAVLLPSGDIAFFGGKDAAGNAISAVEIFQFQPKATGLAQEPNLLVADGLQVAQHSPHAVVLPDRTVLVTGGIDSAGNAVRAAQLFDAFADNDPTTPTTKNPQFLATPGLSMLEGRKLGAAVALSSGHVLFAGGGADAALPSLELFNFRTRQFEAIDVAMPDGGRADMIASLLGDGTVLLAGGTTAPDNAAAPLQAQADVFRLGARNDETGTWSGEFLNVNGDLGTARRGAAWTAIDNGRVVVVGGLTQSGARTSTMEVFVPEGGSNLRPSARVVLQSTRQSWKFGAPVLYRLTDTEGDDASVVMQWSGDAKQSWRSAALQPDTLAGDISEETAGLTTGTFDDTEVKIDPASNAEDHTFIWEMSADIDRPPVGEERSPFNVRVIPYGSVRGIAGESVPVTVLFNTKVVASVLPFEDDNGVVTPSVGGDIRLNVHVRDVDGDTTGPATQGDTTDLLFEYAVDANRNNQIDLDEFWFQMTPAGAAVNAAPIGNTNPKIGLASYNDAPAASDPVGRPADKGWTSFLWDSVFDLGVPAVEFDNVWVRVTPSDADTGIAQVLRNVPGEDDTLNVVPHPEGLRLLSFNPQGGAQGDLVAADQPIEFNFKGTVNPASVNGTTLEIYRNNSRVTGRYVTANDSGANTSRVTFYPDVQNLVDGQPTTGIDDATTVFFPLNEYRINIPAYEAQANPLDGNFLRTLTAGPPAVFSTYLLVQNVEIDGDSDPRYRFSINTDHYDDGQSVAFGSSVPAANGTLGEKGRIDFTVNHALDVDTVTSPNIQVFVEAGGVKSVVPGTWSVTNTRNADGTTTATLTFQPLLQYPPSSTVTIDGLAGLLGTNGTTATAVDRVFSVDLYGGGQPIVNFTEGFDDAVNRDAAATSAAWGDDACNPGVLTGLQGDPSVLPLGGEDLLVKDGQSIQLTSTLNDYDNIEIEKGGELVLRATKAITLRAAEDFIVRGSLSFAGEDGFSGHHGKITNVTAFFSRNGSTNIGTRPGGRGFNSGGDGGDTENKKTSSTQLNHYVLGDNGGGLAGGQGGRIPTGFPALNNQNQFFYGAGGGAGAGHATAGFNGTQGYSRTTIIVAAYGSPSLGGAGGIGDADMGNGPSAGSGGGGGASNGWNNNGMMQGGGGGSGGGAVTILTNGKFVLAPSGLVNGRGGNGGNSAGGAGGGGGGSGGGLLVKAGGGAQLDGLIDMRGGVAGPPAHYSYTDGYAYLYARYNGPQCAGGDGGLGRVRVEASNLGAAQNIRVFGQLYVRKIDELPSFPAGSPTAQDTAFSGSGSSTKDFGSTTQVFYSSLSIAAGKTVTLAGTKALKIFVNGDVDIAGTLSFDGDTAVNSNDRGFTNIVNNLSQATATNYPGAKGQMGGGQGGEGIGYTAASPVYNHRGSNGRGPAGGVNAMQTTNGGYNINTVTYWSGDAGGSGGSNASRGDGGDAPYALGGFYRYSGAAADSVVNGVNGVRQRFITESPAALDPTDVSLSNFDSFVGSGGGGGNAGGYTVTTSTKYWGLAGEGGGGAGAVAIIAKGKLTVSGKITGRGGEGRPSNAASSFSFSASSGGGGSGGTLHLIGSQVSITPATAETKSGAELDMSGGLGGGWRSDVGRYNGSSAIVLQYPVYNTHGNLGGHGGFGRVVVDYVDTLNGSADTVLLNKWGLTQSAAHDNRAYYRALAGSFTSACYAKPVGDTAQSKWIDLGSVRPSVLSLLTSQVSDATIKSLQIEGAHSHPHNLGAGGAGEPDPSTGTGFAALSGTLGGYRFMRWKVVFGRASTRGNPSIGQVQATYRTDNPTK